MQDLINIKEIGEDFICTNDKIIQIIKVNALNFNLMSVLEKKALIQNFKNFLISLNSNFQILIKIIRLNQTKTFEYLKKERLKDTDIFNEDITNDYIKFLKDIGDKNIINEKEYYLISSTLYSENNFNEKLNMKKVETNFIISELNNFKNNSKILKKESLIKLISDFLE